MGEIVDLVLVRMVPLVQTSGHFTELVYQGFTEHRIYLMHKMQGRIALGFEGLS